MKKLEESQATWLRYRDQACDAIDQFYEGGSIRPAAVARCNIQLTRSRMRDLDALYWTALHN